jgi:hypothetical protein
MKEKGWIQRTDSGGFAITAAGVDAVEEGVIIFSSDRLLPGPDEFSHKTKSGTKPNNFKSRFRRLIPNPY